MSTLAETLASPAVLCKALRMNDQMLEAGARAKPQRPSIEPLTSLRAFAAIYVLVFHSGTQYLVKGKLVSGPLATFLLNGYIGVNFFFVLSGFILQYIYGRRLQTRNDVAEYGIARFARVYPVYLLALILTCLFVFDATLSAVPQFLLLQSWSSPAIGQPDNWNTPGWTLSVELLFYILFPVITLKVRELGATTLVISAIFICFFMMVMRSPAHPGIPAEQLPFPWFFALPLPLTRFPEFLYGLILGEIYLRARPRDFNHTMVQFILVVALLLLMCATASAWAPTLATIIVGCLILSIALGGKTALARLFSHPSLVLLGAASYSLYILQFPVREIVRFALAEYGDMLSRLLYIPILIMFSIFIFKFFEEKIRISLRHWRARLQP